MTLSVTPDTLRTYQILIVDDDQVDRRHYRRLLAPSMFGRAHVHQAVDGATGLAAVQAQQFDCVLLDYHLPDMSGIEFLKAVSKDGQPPFAVVLLSGTDTESLTVEAAKCGAQEHLIKGKVDKIALWRAITMTVAQTELRKHLAGLVRDLTQAYAALEQEAAIRRATETELREANTGLARLTRHLFQAQEEAKKANRAKSGFVANMSHELRTPLNGILGYAYLLQMEGGLSRSQALRVEAMISAGQHLLQMITSVLDLSEIEAEHVLLRPSELDVHAIGSACLALVRPMADAKGLVLSMSVELGTSPKLTADPMRLRQILVNLLGNATKFTRQGRIELRLRAAAMGSMLRIEIADTGPGISPAQAPLLFQSFERLEGNETNTAEGAGLGLALSARLASLMGGRIGHDDNPGGGSVFWLELPLDTVARSIQATPPASDMTDGHYSQTPVRTLRILVVDDTAMNRDIAGGFLREAGHTVTSCKCGVEAVAAAASEDFNVILMDVRMPGMDGLEATRHIRALQGIRGRVPILALTAQAFTEQIANCHQAGMDGHVSKPFSPDALVAAVMQATADDRRLGVDLLKSTRSDLSTASDPSVVGTEIPIINLADFERTASYLSSTTVESYQRTIAELGATTLKGLRTFDATTGTIDELANDAHQLAGSAGLLGFERIATIGRRFEQALRSDSPNRLALADGLRAAVEDTLRSIHQQFPVAVKDVVAWG